MKEANEVLDIMRLENDDRYGYNRYLDSLHLKASEVFSLQTEAEYKLKDEIALKSIKEGLDNDIISKITGLTIEKIQELRSETEN